PEENPMKLDSRRTVRELAIEIPNATRTFEKLGIDYCCGGSKSLDDACLHAHVELEDVLNDLARGGVQHSVESNGQDIGAGPLNQLIDNIVGTHHAYVKQELPRLQQLLHKVLSVHGKAHPELAKIRDVFQGMADELTAHMMKEERILFP